MKKILLLCFVYCLHAADLPHAIVPFAGLAASLQALLKELKKTSRKVHPDINIK